jgi:LysM repeat protein
MPLRPDTFAALGCATAILATVATAPSLGASTRNEIVAGQLAPAARKQLETLTAFSPAAMEEIAAGADRSVVEARAAAIWALGNPSLGARPVDADGHAPVHRYLRSELERLAPHGVEFLGALRVQVQAPVTLDRLPPDEPRREAATLTLGDDTIPVYPLWPNGAMPSLVPQGGLSGPLVYAGRAEWSDLRGLPLPGSIAVVDFAAGRRFERLFSLGAQAVVVLEDDFVNAENAERLFMQTPLPYPRFFVPRADAARVRDRAIRSTRDTDDQGRPGLTPGEHAHLLGGHVYQARPAQTLFAWLPPTEPRRYRVTPGTLLELIAADHGFAARDLLEANHLDSPVLTPGQSLRIPGGRGRHTVRPGELAERLARLFSTPLRDLIAANPALAEATANTDIELVVPTVDTPFVIVAPIDAVSVVPDLPHGGRAAGNLAVALGALEHLATSRTLVRRRGVLFVFTDGDTLGGMASRTFAEYVLLAQGRLGDAAADDRARTVERYAAGTAFFQGQPVPDAVTARWLAEDWLWTRVEDTRIHLAERRIPLVMARAAGATFDPDELRQLESDIDFVSGLRRQSLDRRGQPPAERLALYQRALSAPEAVKRAATLGLDLAHLASRFAAEQAEEVHALADHENNLALAGTVLDRLNPGGRLPEDRFLLGYHFDFSGATPVTSFVQASSSDAMRRPIRAAGQLATQGSRLRQVLAYAAVVGGWREEFPFVSEEDRATFPFLASKMPPLYDEFWLPANIALLPLGTRNDQHQHLDTPRDTLADIDFEHLAVQARHALAIVRLGAESPPDAAFDRRMAKPDFSRIVGRTVRFNPRSGIDARDPVAGAYVFFPGAPGALSDRTNAHAFRGARRGVVVQSLLSGSYRFPLEDVAYNRRPRVLAYRLDPEKAHFVEVANQGQVGTREQRPETVLLRGRDTEKNVVMSTVSPLVLYPGTDPMSHRSIGGTTRDAQRLRLVDAVLDGPPRDFAVDNPLPDYRERGIDAVVLYAPPGRRVRAIVQHALFFRMLLVGEVDPATGRGRGHAVGTEGGEPVSIHLPFTPLHLADQMLALARHRLEIYSRYGIRSQTLREALERAELHRGEAHAAAAERDWQRAIGEAREAWGIVVKNYPRVLRLGREAVFSVIVLMAALVPAAWFLERLLIGARGIIGRLVGTTALVAAGTLFLNFTHPAFRIALSPFIVVIAFTMILMSVVVLGLSYGRFEVLLRRWRAAGGEVESEEIGWGSSLATAFSLGVANLRKRAGRTALTTLTVAVLTFSVVAFVSVSGRDTLVQRAVPLDDWAGNQRVEPLPPAYEGVLFRTFQWQELEETTISSLQTEFGHRFPLTVRAHYIEAEGGNNAEREGINQIPVVHGGRSTILTAILAFAPEEREFSALHRAVSHETWFRGDQRDGDRFEPGDRWHVILPAPAARELGIEPAHLVDADGRRRPEGELPVVRFANRTWRVIGILDPALANRIRDVNGRSLAVVDYLRSAMNRNVTGELENEGESYHLDWSEMIVVPLAAARDVGALPRSLALKFPPGQDTARFFADLALRLETPMFAHVDGRTVFLTTRERVQLGGLAKLIVPIVLCVLIVMNTMMGTVDERRGEVAMLGAIGLSPRQISFLLLAEATVFSVLALVFGTFAGLAAANGLVALQGRGVEFLSGLSFNFTSLPAMLLATGTGVVVLLATLLPARRAAAVAAPSGMAKWQLPPVEADGSIRFVLPFTLTRGNVYGMLAFFRQFLLNHSEPTSAGFNCRELSLSRADGPRLQLGTLLWLSPYDLDVSQTFRLRLDPSDTPGVFGVTLELRRLSGSEEAWLRTNHGFLDLVRQQFLYWRNLPQAARDGYIAAGRALAETAVPVPTAPDPTELASAARG